MGLRGPAKKSAEAARRDGTYRPDRHSVVLVGDRVTPAAIPKAPAHLSTRAKKAWRELLEPLAEGLIQTADLAAVEMASVALATYREADAHVKKQGVLIDVVFAYDRDTGAPITKPGPHPALAIRDRAAAEFMRWASRFGLTPSDRVTLGLGQIEGKTKLAALEAGIGKSPRRAASGEA